MPRVEINLGTGLTQGADGQVANVRHINAFVEMAGGEAKNETAIYACPGLEFKANAATNGPARGLIERGPNSLVTIIGQEVSEFDTSFNKSVIGALPGSGRVQLARNQNATPQIGIVTDAGTYYVLEGSSLTQITDQAISVANGIAYLNGYMLFTTPDAQGRFYASELNDAKAILAASFDTANAKPDLLVRPFTQNRFAFIFGRESLEIWRDVGKTPFPLAPFQQNIDAGLMATHAVATFDNSVTWVDHKGRVVSFKESTPIRISDHSVERKIARLTPAQKSSLAAFSYWHDGHEVWSLSSSEWTVEYDASTQRWHERMSYGFNRWRADTYAFFDQRHICGDTQSGKLFEITPDALTEDGQPLVMRTLAPVVHDYPNGLVVSSLFVDTIAGQGKNSTDTHVSDPKVMMKVSRDGGKTFGPERITPLGKIGEFYRTVRFNKLGHFRQKGGIVDLSISAGVQRGFVQAYVEASGTR